MITLRGQIWASRTDDDFPCPPYVHSKRPRVYIQNVPVCTGTTRTCVSTCARGAGTHGDILNAHTGTFWTDTLGFSACHTTHRTENTTTETTPTTHNNTPQQQTPPEQHTETETERDKTREDGREDERREKTRREKMRRQEKRQDEEEREDEREKKREDERENEER